MGKQAILLIQDFHSPVLSVKQIKTHMYSSEVFYNFFSSPGQRTQTEHTFKDFYWRQLKWGCGKKR